MFMSNQVISVNGNRSDLLSSADIGAYAGACIEEDSVVEWAGMNCIQLYNPWKTIST